MITVIQYFYHNVSNFFFSPGGENNDDDNFNQSLEEAIENEDTHIDTYADEDEPHQLTKIKLVDTGTKEESDIDVSLNLEAESQLGK